MKEKLLNRKELTPEQYQRANKTMSAILTLCYVIFAIVEFTNLDTSSNVLLSYLRCGLYIGLILVIQIVSRKAGDKKIAMVVMAVTFVPSYIALVAGNGVAVLASAFPILIGFMIYLNARVVGLGCIIAFIVCMVKTASLKMAGMDELYMQANLITMTFVVGTLGAIQAVNLLISFSKEDQEVIKEEVERQKEVADTVSGIVEKVGRDFHQIKKDLEAVNLSMSSAHTAMESIAGSSESTAEAVNQQADMTSQIQARLERTNETASDAMVTTEKLKDVVVEGKSLADELQKQSVLVDQNTTRISETMELLVTNVEKVSDITDSIISISSQTNLLALNASIEAARAGEAGRGFAVVADQIRKLAEETKSSTEKITEIINELMAVTNETQAGIEESVESINVQREKVEEVNASFTEVENGMLGLGSDVVSMSREVGEVLDANKAIVDSISLLSATSEEVSAGTQTSKETIDETMETLSGFCKTIDDAFEQLKILIETVQRN